jgi:hypothetical protein
MIWLRILALVILIVAYDVPTAAQSKIQHPIFDYHLKSSDAPALEQQVAKVMSFDEATIVRLLPDRTPILFCGCPNCNKGPEENGMTIFDWDIDHPNQLRCKYCGHVYPSGQYPEDQLATGKNMLGETVTYHFYLDKKTGRDYWLSACADFHRKEWFLDQCLLLAKTYHLTGKQLYARRASLILEAFAQSYPHLAVLDQWPFRRRSIAAPTPPFPSAGGKWGRWLESEIPDRLPEAYDLIYDSVEIANLSHERKINMRKVIEDDFFQGTFGYIQTFGKEPTGRHLTNIYSNALNLVRIGRVIGEPNFVHWGYKWVENMLNTQFCFDGMFPEGPSYHNQTIGGIRLVMGVLKGYSDPAGYHSEGGPLLKDVDMESQAPLVKKALAAPGLIRYPDGHICPVHDTWASESSGSPESRGLTTLLPGFGHASLGCGTGADLMAAQIHFSMAAGHSHRDTLNLSLFAKGVELFSDIGYTHTKLRNWATCTVAHNTVVIDRKEQSTGDSGGDLQLFVSDVDGVSVIDVQGERAYPGLAKVYRRELILVPISDADGYVVDLFSVKGGSNHDWLVHGSADAAMKAEASLSMKPQEGTLIEPGEPWKDPENGDSIYSGYGLIKALRQGETDKPFMVNFQEGSGRRVRTHLVGTGKMQVLIGESPQVRPAKEDDGKVYDFWMPQLVARRVGVAPLESMFVAVHEPFRGKPFIESATAVPLDPAVEFGCALRVQHGEYVDTIVSTHEAPPFSARRLPDGTIIRAHLGILRERAGKIVKAWLIDGTEVSRAAFTLKNDRPEYEGEITGATRKADGAKEDALLTNGELPDGKRFGGTWVVVFHGDGHTHGYEVDHIEKRGGGSAIVLTDDHGLRIDGVKTNELFFPRREFNGTNRFRLIQIQVWSAPGS